MRNIASKEKGVVLDWFDIDAPEGGFTILRLISLIGIMNISFTKANFLK